MHSSFLTMITVSLFYSYQKVFILKSLPEKDAFFSHLNMEDITDADYAHAKRFVKI